MKRPKTFIGVWDDQNAYFPHLDGLSVMIFEHKDLPVDRRFVKSAADIFSWLTFVWRHTDSQVVLTKEGN
ncbi:MAG TPA: hypothetical protein PKD61_25350 [Polyangiaceae bacterium]|nr:hypothetical protein [Polyangiaceae bacterium]